MAHKTSQTRIDASAGRRSAVGLGRKGVETRLRLMDAARDLLLSTSPVSLTVAAIARAARTSSATFYVYFDDVVGVVQALASEASEDMGEVVAALERWSAGMPPSDGAAGFIAAFRTYYARHRPIFAIRNMEADRGNERFFEMRARAGEAILSRLAALIEKGRRDKAHAQVKHNEAVARASVIYSAIERLAASEDLYSGRRREITSEDLVDAQIALLVQVVGSAA